MAPTMHKLVPHESLLLWRTLQHRQDGALSCTMAATGMSANSAFILCCATLDYCHIWESSFDPKVGRALDMRNILSGAIDIMKTLSCMQRKMRILDHITRTQLLIDRKGLCKRLTHASVFY
jgi:hypothetical protein